MTFLRLWFGLKFLLVFSRGRLEDAAADLHVHLLALLEVLGVGLDEGVYHPVEVLQPHVTLLGGLAGERPRLGGGHYLEEVLVARRVVERARPAVAEVEGPLVDPPGKDLLVRVEHDVVEEEDVAVDDKAGRDLAEVPLEYKGPPRLEERRNVCPDEGVLNLEGPCCAVFNLHV